MSNWIGVLCILASAILFSLKSIFIKFAYLEGIDPISLLTLRMAFALPFFTAVLFFVKPPVKTPSGKDYFHVALIGLAGYYLASIFDFIGLQYISAGLERIILFLYPTFVVIFSALFYKERLPKKGYISLGLTYVGLVVVFGDAHIANQQNLTLGTVYVLGCAISYALYLSVAGGLIPKFGALRFTSSALIVSSLCTFVHYTVVARLDHLFHYESKIYLWALALAILSTVMPTFLVAEGIKRIGSSRMAIIASVGPVSTLIFGYIFLGEKLGLSGMLGTALVLVGVLLVSKQKNTPSSPLATTTE